MSRSVYLIWAGRYYKIGESADPYERAKQVVRDVGRPGWEEVLHTFPSANSKQVEKALHKRFEDVCVDRGEWFDLTDEDVSRICQLGRTDTVEDLPPDLRERPAGVVVRIRIDRRLLLRARTVAVHSGLIGGTSTDVHDYLRTILISAIERDWAGIKHLVVEHTGGEESSPPVSDFSEDQPPA